jgi:hypothetical protein
MDKTPSRPNQNADKVRRWRKRHPEKVRAYGRVNNRARRLRLLGMTLADYDKAFQAQGSMCAMGHHKRHKLDYMVDHNHKTGTFRGILCGHCNSVIGHAQDDPKLLRKLARYLEKHK